MSSRPQRLRAGGGRGRALAAAALVGVLLPWGVGTPAVADDEESPPAPLAYGYSSLAWAAPVHVEVFEPSLPIPTSPQLEFMLAYSKAKADSGTSSGRASWMWPGDPVGEGLKTFGEQLGLPPQLFAGGYPVQVNAVYPSDEQSQKDEPFPGMVMRASASDGSARGTTGFTPDGDVEEPATAGGMLAGLLSPLGLDQLAGLGKEKAKAETGVPAMPPGLATLVDFNGYVSTSTSEVVDGEVQVTSKSRLGDVSLLGGLIKLSGVNTVARASTSGGEGEAGGKAHYGSLALLGQEFAIGPEGIEAVGQRKGIPGLSANPAKALEKLGISITVPEQERTVEEGRTVSVSRGLVIEVKTDLLTPVLSLLPLGQLTSQLPDQLGPLKSVLGGLGSLAPRVVFTLGEARASVETVGAFDDPGTGEEPAPGDDTPPATDAGGDDTGTPAVDDLGAPDLAETPTDAGAPPADSSSAPVDGDLPPSQATSAGLPKLFSIPGATLFGAIAAAVGIGAWVRRAGLLALGLGGACSHGLDSGIPDLRKV